MLHAEVKRISLVQNLHRVRAFIFLASIFAVQAALAIMNKSLNSLLGANSGVLSRYTACGPTFARMIMTENVI